MTFQTFTPAQYLQIDIASNFGLDKETWDTRLEWFAANEDLLTLDKPIAEIFSTRKAHPFKDLMKQADEPALFFAGVKAWNDHIKGYPINYPISLDATSSGAQILAVLIGCHASAKLCNVIDTGDREDLYQNVYDLMMQRLAANERQKLDHPSVKKAVMTSLYGSKREPIKAFGDGPVLAAFYETMDEDAPGIWDLNQGLLSLWQPHALSHDWVMPDNFHVKTKVMDARYETFEFLGEYHQLKRYVNAPTDEGRSIGANVVHSIDGMIVRELIRRCDYQPSQVNKVKALIAYPQRMVGSESSVQRAYNDALRTMEGQQLTALLGHYDRTGIMSARVLDYINSQTVFLLSEDQRQAVLDVLQTFPARPFKVLSVHDCFRVHPNYANDLRRMFNQLLHELARSTVLDSIAQQITRNPDVKATPFGDVSQDVLEANYALS